MRFLTDTFVCLSCAVQVRSSQVRRQRDGEGEMGLEREDQAGYEEKGRRARVVQLDVLPKDVVFAVRGEITAAYRSFTVFFFHRYCSFLTLPRLFSSVLIV